MSLIDYSKIITSQDKEYERRKILEELINQERDRRISAGFIWNGNKFQSDADSMSNISGAATSAIAFILSGGDVSSYRWSSSEFDFVWITADNNTVRMNAIDTINFGNAAKEHKAKMIFAARTLKNMESIPEDYEDNKWWE